MALLTFHQWRIKVDPLSIALLTFAGALLVSCVQSFIYSGLEVAAGSLIRALLFCIAVYAFFFVRDGLFRYDNAAVTTLLRVIFWAAIASMTLACLDFFFQFPAAPGHSLQFIWLDSGVYRRAQGVFYESSTLGNLSVFVLVMIVLAWLEPRMNIAPQWALLAGSIPVVVALLMSYSRGSLGSLGIALICLTAIKGRWSQWKRALGVAAAVLAVSLVAAFSISPALASVVWLRMAASLEYFWSSPNAVLSGRLNNWITLVNYMSDESWKLVLGIGYKTLPISGISDSPLIADNTYLSVLIETGVLGLAALIALNFTIIRRAYRAARSSNLSQSFLGTWMFCFWLGESVQMLSGDLLTYWRILPAFFCVMALADRGAP